MYEEIEACYEKDKHREERFTFFGKLFGRWSSPGKPDRIGFTGVDGHTRGMNHLFDDFYVETEMLSDFEYSTVYKILFNQSKAHIQSLLSS